MSDNESDKKSDNGSASGSGSENDNENGNKIKILYDIQKSETETHIFGEKFVENNEDHCEMIINGKQDGIAETIIYEDYNISKENPQFEILLTGVDKIKDCSFMFDS